MAEDCERYCSIEESIIQSCKEVNLIRKGLLPAVDAREWLDELRKKYKNELDEDDTQHPKEA